MSSPLSAQQRVAAGAALLDEKMPRWDLLIDLSTFDVGGCTTCVLGQIYGRYLEGRSKIGIENAGVDHGFFWLEPADRAIATVDDAREYSGSVELDIEALNDEWRKLILSRRPCSECGADGPGHVMTCSRAPRHDDAAIAGGVA